MATNPNDPNNPQESQKEIIKRLLEIVGKLVDYLPATSMVKLPDRFLGFKFNDGIIGMGGLVSSIIAMWGIWTKYN